MKTLFLSGVAARWFSLKHAATSLHVIMPPLFLSGVAAMSFSVKHALREIIYESKRTERNKKTF